MIRTVKIKYAFRNASDAQIASMGGSVLKGMTGNAAFPTPPVSMEMLKKSVNALSDAIVAASQGGTLATAAKNNKRHEVVAILRELGHYVQAQSKNDLTVLLSSGFMAQNPHRIQVALMKPSILSLDRGMSTQLKVRVTPIPNARGYEVRFAATGTDGAPGPWQTAGFFTNSRTIPVNGLTPGIFYWVQVRALGGTTGTSDWSDAVRCMAG